MNRAFEFSFYGKNKSYYITTEDDYTHAIILNTAMPYLRIPKENVLGLAFEPIYFLGLTPEFIQYAKNYIGRYFIGEKNELPRPFIEHFGYMWYCRPPKEIPLNDKNNVMSIIVSNKNVTSGHRYRHEFVKKIIEQKLPIDIYGHGSSKYTYDRIRGSFQEDSVPFQSYLFSICIENVITNDYFTEKVMNPLMHNCVPIYSGCKNINNYVENVILLQNDIEKDIALVKNILNNPDLYYKKTYTEKNKKAINLIEHLPELFP
jgi:hypothetical protein